MKNRLSWPAYSALATAVLCAVPLLAQTQPAATESAPSVPYSTEIMPDIAKLKPAPNMPAATSDLRSIQARSEAVARSAMPAVVNIAIFGDEPGEGSGVIVSKDGYVLTAGHVSGQPGTRIGFRLSNGTMVTGVSLGANGQVDSGLCKITTPGTYPYAPLGSTRDLSTGQWVMTIGHPGGWQGGRDPVVRLGKVLNVKLPTTKNPEWFVQSDCTIIMGDSGGPVFDLDGRVIGINSRIGIENTANVHVPIDTFEDTWDRLAKSDRWGYGGILTRLTTGPEAGPTVKPKATMSLNARNDDAGVVVLRVSPDKAADKAGVQTDDVITKVNGQLVKTREDLASSISKLAPGETVTLDLMRNSKTMQVKLVLDAATGTSNSSQQVDTALTKSTTGIKNAFAEATRQAEKSTVRVLVQDTNREVPAALGTVISSDGFILTKSSEVINHKKIFVKVAGKDQPAKVVGVRESYDLAMLKVDAKDLTPVTLANTAVPAGTKPAHQDVPEFTVNLRDQLRPLAQPTGPIPAMAPLTPPLAGAVAVNVGELVVTPDAGGSEVANLDPKNFGVISVQRRTIPFASGVLGVQLDEFLSDTSPRPQGALVTQVFPQSGAGRAGVKPGDVVTALDGARVDSRETLQSLIRRHYPTDTITLSITRGALSLSLKVQLGDTILATPEDMEMAMLSGQVSTRSTDFQAVFQHDTVLAPSDMGGPLVDLDGHVIGINIARAGRTETYAIPADLLTERWIESMKDGTFAPKAKP